MIIIVSIDPDGLVFRPLQKVAQPHMPRKIFVECNPDEFHQYDAVATLLTGSLTEGVEFVDAVTGRVVKLLL